mmetsp:Transcript_44693/g.137907  ORF Transcript_44693/g.137907 Transcript_44693/m.137907 type:complete len:271 (-) Transcript_44693:285-1097(-)
MRIEAQRERRHQRRRRAEAAGIHSVARRQDRRAVACVELQGGLDDDEHQAEADDDDAVAGRDEQHLDAARHGEQEDDNTRADGDDAAPHRIALGFADKRQDAPDDVHVEEHPRADEDEHRRHRRDHARHPRHGAHDLLRRHSMKHAEARDRHRGVAAQQAHERQRDDGADESGVAEHLGHYEHRRPHHGRPQRRDDGGAVVALHERPLRELAGDRVATRAVHEARRREGHVVVVVVIASELGERCDGCDAVRDGGAGAGRARASGRCHRC